MTVTGMPYKVRATELGFTVVREAQGGGSFVVDGPYNTQYEAEVAARRRAKAGKTGRR